MFFCCLGKALLRGFKMVLNKCYISRKLDDTERYFYFIESSLYFGLQYNKIFFYAINKESGDILLYANSVLDPVYYNQSVVSISGDVDVRSFIRKHKSKSKLSVLYSGKELSIKRI